VQEIIRTERFRKGRTPNPAELTGGKPSPKWIEWLMGYPSNWTELNVSEMQSYPRKCPKHLKD